MMSRCRPRNSWNRCRPSAPGSGTAVEDDSLRRRPSPATQHWWADASLQPWIHPSTRTAHSPVLPPPDWPRPTSMTQDIRHPATRSIPCAYRSRCHSRNSHTDWRYRNTAGQDSAGAAQPHLSSATRAIERSQATSSTSVLILMQPPIPRSPRRALFVAYSCTLLRVGILSAGTNRVVSLRRGSAVPLRVGQFLPFHPVHRGAGAPWQGRGKLIHVVRGRAIMNAFQNWRRRR